MYRLRRYIEYWVFIQAESDVLTCIMWQQKIRQQMEEKLHVEKDRTKSKYYFFCAITPSINMPQSNLYSITGTAGRRRSPQL
jgi:hypothetical protein